MMAHTRDIDFNYPGRALPTPIYANIRNHATMVFADMCVVDDHVWVCVCGGSSFSTPCARCADADNTRIDPQPYSTHYVGAPTASSYTIYIWHTLRDGAPGVAGGCSVLCCACGSYRENINDVCVCVCVCSTAGLSNTRAHVQYMCRLVDRCVVPGDLCVCNVAQYFSCCLYMVV